MQAQAALLKREIEAKLANRIPTALSPVTQQAARLHPTGNSRINSLLGGGLPLGSVCELTGPDGSGRCSVALSLLAEASSEGACAYIDVSDTLSPQSAAAAGIELPNLLWVRFTATKGRTASSAPMPGLVPADESLHRPVHGGCGSSHPRGETKGLAPALEQMLFYKEERRRLKMEGTPGHPNQPLGLHGLAGTGRLGTLQPAKSRRDGPVASHRYEGSGDRTAAGCHYFVRDNEEHAEFQTV